MDPTEHRHAIAIAPPPPAEGNVARAVHCYALRQSGVHGVSLDEALALFEHAPAQGERPFVWIDIVCPGPQEEILLRERLRFHALAVEDCMSGRQRPKLDRYPGYFFLVAYAALVNAQEDRTELEELHMFVGDHYVVTVHDNKMKQITQVLARWRTNESAFPTIGALAHALLDVVVDSYLPAIEHLAEHVDFMERMVFDPDQDNRMQSLLELRHEVALTRRLLSPLREILRTITRRDILIFNADLLPYFHDVLDHVERETEELDSLRETLAATLDAYMSASAHSLNSTMRVMTSWSIILMAVTLIAGIYGMNFHYMPELSWRLGYLWALVLMVIVGGGIFAYFKRRRWV